MTGVFYFIFGKRRGKWSSAVSTAFKEKEEAEAAAQIIRLNSYYDKVVVRWVDMED